MISPTTPPVGKLGMAALGGSKICGMEHHWDIIHNYFPRLTYPVHPTIQVSYLLEKAPQCNKDKMSALKYLLPVFWEYRRG